MPEDGPGSKKTVFIANVAEDVDEAALLEAFSTFGDIVDVQLPLAATNPAHVEVDRRHRGFAFVTFAAMADAQDAIDNMDLNVFRGKVVKVSIATSTKIASQPAGNRPIWETEEWQRTYGSKEGKAADAEPELQAAQDEEEEAMEE
ncbi:RNA-binding domain-containing protein [Exidia glandulosa HHB12029]|uniref:RNA-binding domain-containing protein n=1 Tax=Exidia glandulosa HHB12029 TaxID=1314781 RepID=A0A165GAX3_EXIGL|nr:RNA-binding domain-containing protein [Exidia glandulosa HHB12029]